MLVQKGKIFIFVIGLMAFGLLADDLLAKRLLPSSLNSGKVLGRQIGQSFSGSKPTSKVKKRADGKAIVVTLSNLSSAKSVSYLLSYDANGTTQGASGSVNVSESTSVVRELLFGSCSKGVCRYDSGIKNAKFVVTSVLKNGQKVIKPFRIK
ncbi:MAG: hypothetical protein AAB685_01130, partial [Patescibacteria group bacterium]